MTVGSRPEELRLAVHAEGLSANQRRVLASFAAGWADADSATLSVRAPSAGPDRDTAWRFADEVRAALARDGVDAAVVNVIPYDQPAGEPPVVVLAYERTVAMAAHCGHWEDLTATGANREYANFGCAVTGNMAAEMAHPSDVVAPEASTPPSASRRQAVMDAWRSGAATSSAKDEQASGAISSAVQ